MLTVLIGFCILAVIEIIYGQARIRLEKERIAMLEETQQSVQTLRDEWDQTKEPDQSVGNVAVDTESGADLSAKDGSSVPDQVSVNTGDSGGLASADTTDSTGHMTISANNLVAEENYDMQIVFLGDSILDSDRDNEGVAALISKACNAKVYNMAMGGTTAALLPDERYDYDHWTSRGLLGVVNAILGNIGPELFEGYKAGEILKTCDFSQTDYFVIEYGINDFFSGIVKSRYLADGSTLAVSAPNTYFGALTQAVDMLHTAFPAAKIMIITPHYCQIFQGETFMGDAYSLNGGQGALIEYYHIAINAYEACKDKNVILYDTFENSGIDAYTADEYLEDGVHLTAAGRRVYADYAARLINSDFRREE